MPGTLIRTEERSGPARAQVGLEATAFIVGITQRGPVDRAVELANMADYRRHFGGDEPWADGYAQALTYFEEAGGGRVIMGRDVGPNAVVASRILANAAAVNIARVEAANPGAWASRVTTQVIAGRDAGTRTLVVFLDGDEVERFSNFATPADLADALAPDEDGRGGSAWVRGVDLASGSADLLPVIEANPVAFTTAGTDDRAAINDASRVAVADALFTEEYGTGMLVIPGLGVGAGDALDAHLAAHNRIGGFAPPAGSSAQDAIALAAGLPESEYLGVFYPHVYIPITGGRRLIDPQGYVAGVRARSILTAGRGVWDVPAGKPAEARFVRGTEVAIDRATGDALNLANVSAIRRIAGTTRLYGWRSLWVPTAPDDELWYFLKDRDVVNYAAVQVDQLVEDAVFGTIDPDGRFTERLAALVKGVLDPIRQAGGLYSRTDAEGVELDRGYSVSVDPIVGNRVTVRFGLRTSPSAELIEVVITKVGLRAAV